jgi:hypothetical protein
MWLPGAVTSRFVRAKMNRGQGISTNEAMLKELTTKNSGQERQSYEHV